MADYRYNALGQQVSRTVQFGGGAAAVTLSVHDLAGNRLAEHDAGGAVLREYIWLDGRPLAIIEAGQTYWLHWDQIGRPVMATDATGAVVWAASRWTVRAPPSQNAYGWQSRRGIHARKAMWQGFDMVSRAGIG